MKKPIAITTRPYDDALRDAKQLAERGITCLAAPMLEIIPLNTPMTEDEDIDAVVLTSRHAAGLMKASVYLNHHCYCVGETTARAAAEAGFTSITTGPGDGKGLAEHIQKDGAKKVFWPSAVDTGFNMAGALETIGIKTLRQAVYKAAKTESFPQEVEAALAEKSVAAVLMHSGRAGEHFHHLMIKHGFGDAISSITAIAISARAAGLCGDGWRNIMVAKTPRRSSMFDALTQVIK